MHFMLVKTGGRKFRCIDCETADPRQLPEPARKREGEAIVCLLTVDSSSEGDAANDELMNPEHRNELVRDILMYACLFPPGPEQDQLRSIARTLTFFDVNSPPPDEDLTDVPVQRIFDDARPSAPDVVGIRLPVALFEAIDQWARTERMSRSNAFRILLGRAIRVESLGRH